MIEANGAAAAGFVLSQEYKETRCQHLKNDLHIPV